jgi:hypothetical protein
MRYALIKFYSIKIKHNNTLLAIRQFSFFCLPVQTNFYQLIINFLPSFIVYIAFGFNINMTFMRMTKPKHRILFLYSSDRNPLTTLMTQSFGTITGIRFSRFNWRNKYIANRRNAVKELFMVPLSNND